MPPLPLLALRLRGASVQRLSSAALLCSLCQLASAAGAPTANPVDPANPKASSPDLQHRSALRHYQPLQERPVGDWPTANRRVQQLGGWRHYLREAQAGAAPAISPASPASAAAAPAAAASRLHAH